jgi:uncharacterized membrane protein YkvA (DUF1232 family)
MKEHWREPFTQEEMRAFRQAMRDDTNVLSESFAMLSRLAKSLPFAEDALAAYHCVRDPATAPRVKIILLSALAYLVMPVDAVPDFLPLLGFGDDAAAIATAIATVREAIRAEHREKARETLER